MPYGLGFGELIIILSSIVVPLCLVVGGVKLISGMLGSGRSQAREDRQLAAELHQARLRIEELETKVTQVDEKATFTQQLLERPTESRP